MASTSNYAATPKVGSANITAALGGTRTTPTGTSTLFTAGAGGSLVTRAIVQLIGDTGGAAANNVAAFYLFDGATHYLFQEIELAWNAFGAPSGSNQAERVEIPFNDLVLPSGWSVRAGIRVRASAVDDHAITVLGGDF